MTLTGSSCISKALLRIMTSMFVVNITAGNFLSFLGIVSVAMYAKQRNDDSSKDVSN